MQWRIQGGFWKPVKFKLIEHFALQKCDTTMHILASHTTVYTALMSAKLFVVLINLAPDSTVYSVQ